MRYPTIRWKNILIILALLLGFQLLPGLIKIAQFFSEDIIYFLSRGLGTLAAGNGTAQDWAYALCSIAVVIAVALMVHDLFFKNKERR